MPSLFILAGPNGAGKTTYYQSALHQKSFPPELPFLNIDLIARNELGGYSGENFAKAEMIYRERITALLKHKGDFMIESNLARSSDFEWVEQMRNQGYDIILIFLCTDDISININRIGRRVKEGGHDIPSEIVIHRYKMVLTYLKGKLHLFSEAYFLENSSDEPILVAQIVDGKLIELKSPLPKWTEELLFIAKRTAAKDR